MHHPPWWENTSTMITQRRIKVSLAKVENNTKHKTIMPSFLLPDGLFAVRTITSFIHDCNRYCETLRCWTTWQSHDRLTAGSEILRGHKRIYLSSWPRLPSVTMPLHMVIKTITSVTFYCLGRHLPKCQLSFTLTKILPRLINFATAV